ncbi:MAG: FG-GAP repeat domain-containing protein, partial [Gemmataceae bacterium]
VRPGIIVAGSGVGGPAVVMVYDATTRVEKYTLTPYGTSFRGGVRVASADVTGDGHADVITVPGPGMAAWVRVFDGRDGMPVPGPIGRFLGFASSVTTGAFVSAGDVDADGRADVILGTDAGTIARVRIFNGANATFMRMIVPFGGFTGGVRVAAADVNGDGRAEVVTAPGLGRFPVVRAFHASTGATLWSFLAGNRSFERGLFVAAGDADGDGRDDILIGMGAGETTTLRLYRGSNRQLMQSYTPFESGYMGGARTAMLDLDGDGRADPLAGTGSLATSQIILGSAPGSSISPFEDPIRAVFVAAGYSTRP